MVYMAVFEWVASGIVIVFFLSLFFVSTRDLFRDIIYYKKKQQNVKQLHQHNKRDNRKNSMKKNSMKKNSMKKNNIKKIT